MCHDYAPSFLSVVELFLELERVLVFAVDFFVVDDFEEADVF
jgi:hypothetical protein